MPAIELASISANASELVKRQYGYCHTSSSYMPNSADYTLTGTATDTADMATLPGTTTVAGSFSV